MQAGESTDPVQPSRHGAPAGGKREARRAERRRELIEAAIRVIRKEGPGVTMDRMAQEAGITKPILYRHFTDRSGLCSAIAEAVLGDLTNEMERSLARVATTRELLFVGVDSFLQFVERDPALYRFLSYTAPTVLPDSRKPIEDFQRHMALLVASVVRDALEKGGFDPVPSEVWGFSVVGMVHFAERWWVEQAEPPFPREELSRYLGALTWRGLAGGPELLARQAGSEGGA